MNGDEINNIRDLLGEDDLQHVNMGLDLLELLSEEDQLIGIGLSQLRGWARRRPSHRICRHFLRLP